jgi:hypothetical protein
MSKLIFITFQARSNFNISTAVGSTRVTSSYRQLVVVMSTVGLLTTIVEGVRVVCSAPIVAVHRALAYG